MESAEGQKQLAQHTDIMNENELDNATFTVEIKSQVELLIKSAKKQCEKEKALMQAKFHRDLSNLKDQMMVELNKAFEKDLLVPLKLKITENENEIRALRRDLQASRNQEEKLQKDKNMLQNTINILKLRVEKLESQIGNQCYSKPQIPSKLTEDGINPVWINRETPVLEKPVTNVATSSNNKPKSEEYERNKKNSAVITESNRNAGKRSSVNLLDTSTVVLHLEFAPPPPGKSREMMDNTVILYDQTNPGKTEIKTVGELRAMSHAYFNHFGNDEERLSTGQDNNTHVEQIDKELKELQKKTVETQAALYANEMKNAQNTEAIMEEINELKQKIDSLVKTFFDKKTPKRPSIRQVDLINQTSFT